MVAITVILAAVIGVFVLGLGDELGQAQPSNSIDVSGEWHGSGDEISNFNFTASHDSGDAVDFEDVDVVLRQDGATVDSAGLDEIDGDQDELSVGDSVSYDHDEDGPHFEFDDSSEDETPVEIELVHNPSDSIIASGELDDDN